MEDFFDKDIFSSFVQKKDIEKIDEYLSEPKNITRLSLNDISEVVFFILEQELYFSLTLLNNAFPGIFKQVKHHNGATILMQSILQKNEELFNYLLDNFNKEELKLNFQNKNDEQTALHYAAYLYDKNKVKRLLQKGADPLIKDKHKQTALSIAQFNKNKNN